MGTISSRSPVLNEEKTAREGSLPILLGCRKIPKMCVYVKCRIPVSCLTRVSSVSSLSEMSLWGSRHLDPKVGGREAAVHCGVFKSV